ncbi:MAG: hypothetical protein IZT59_10445 [Verrucomicrobia bacterium]|nr:hypothetical protein [Verrucomicrobiota bacterium]
MEKQRRPWWLYFNLLGLDAPVIAVVWLFLFAQTWRVNYHPWEAYAALGLFVWAIRIMGKLLSAAMAGVEEDFNVKHRKALRNVALLAGTSSTVLTVLNFPLSGYNYFLIGAVLVIGYFALALFSTGEDNEPVYAKHLMGGCAFAYGTALMAHAYLPSLGIQQMVLSREFICFAVLCLLASSATDLWTQSGKVEDQEIKAAHELALSLPLTLLGAAALVFAVQNESMSTRPFFYGILTGAALLQILNRMRGRFRIETVKVLTGVCLLAPGMIFEAYAISR